MKRRFGTQANLNFENLIRPRKEKSFGFCIFLTGFVPCSRK